MHISQYIPLISGCGLEHLEDLSIQVGFCHVIMSSQLLLKLHHFSEGLKPQPPTSENKAIVRIHDPQI